MAKKNKNKRRGPDPTTPAAAKSKKKAAKPTPTHGQATRETIESLVIAFVLAFLFRTFQAEAFVIPTGSMAPTLMGRHADLTCTECGQRFRINESELTDAEVAQVIQDQADRGRHGITPAQVMAQYRGVAGQCPDCRHSMWLGPVEGVPASRDSKPQRSYSGDRILVNKYLYSFTDPKRWDVVVFKYPGDAVQNYIKRLVGLPGEELQIEGGDLFVRTSADDEFKIVAKPPKKILAMRQLVHDTKREPGELISANYPLRWNPAGGESLWEADETINGHQVDVSYRVDASDQTSWLRYVHVPPNAQTWVMSESERVDLAAEAEPQLVTDYNAYNTTIDMRQLQRQQGKVFMPGKDRGLHWVGDLIVDAKVDIQSDQGRLTLELVEAGCRFRCTFDVADGTAELTAVPFDGGDAVSIARCDRTGVKGDGRHTLRLANVDNRLTVWVDDSVLGFDAPTDYDANQLLATSGAILPRSSQENPGDLSPAGVGAEGMEATVENLVLWRDIYYIAEKATFGNRSPNFTPSDFELAGDEFDIAVKTDNGNVPLPDLLRDPELWDAFRARRAQQFQLSDDQFFVMGDNSAASSDARLWANGNGNRGGVPGGPYLERKMLIGKAVCVYWPHSFDKVPGTSLPFPLFPNVGDMRLVR